MSERLRQLMEQQERERQEREKRRAEKAEKLRLQNLAQSTFVQSTGQKNYRSHKQNVEEKTSLHKEDVKRRLLAEPGGTFAQNVLDYNEQIKEKATPGWWGKLWNDLIGSGENSAAFFSSLAASDPTSGKLPINPMRGLTGIAGNAYKQSAEKVYKEKGIATDGQGKPIKGAGWEWRKPKVENPALKSMSEFLLGPIDLPFPKDMEVKKEIYDKAEMPWGVKGAMEMIFDPLNVVPVGNIASKGKMGVKQIGKGIDMLGNAAGYHLPDGLRIGKRFIATKIRKKPVEIGYTKSAKETKKMSATQQVYEAQENILNNPQNSLIREIQDKTIGKGRRVLEQLNPSMPDNVILDDLEATMSGIRAHLHRIEEGGHYARPYEQLMKATLIPLYRAKNASAVVTLGKDIKAKAARQFLAYQRRNSMRDTNVSVGTKRFVGVSIGNENKHLYQEGGKYYNKLSETSQKIIKKNPDEVTITDRDLFGINISDGTMNSVDGAGNLNWHNLFEYAFTGIKNGHFHNVVKHHVYNDAKYIYRAGKDAKTQEFIFDMPSKKGDKLTSYTVYLTKEQAEYIFQMQDVVLDGANLLRSAGITDDIIKKYEPLAAKAKEFYDQSKALAKKKYRTKESKAFQRGEVKRLKQLGDETDAEAVKIVTDAYKNIIPGLEDVFAPGGKLAGSRFIPRKIIGIVGDEIDALKGGKGINYYAGKGNRKYIGAAIEDAYSKHGYEYLNSPAKMLEIFVDSMYKYDADFRLQQGLQNLELASSKLGLIEADGPVAKILTSVAKKAKGLKGKDALKEQGIRIKQTEAVVRHIATTGTILSGLKRSFTRGRSSQKGTQAAILKTGKLSKTIEDQFEKLDTHLDLIDDVAEDSIYLPEVSFYKSLRSDIKKALTEARAVRTLQNTLKETEYEKVKSGNTNLKQYNEKLKSFERESDEHINSIINTVQGKIDHMQEQIKFAKEMAAAAKAGTYRERVILQELLVKNKKATGDSYRSMWDNYHVDESIIGDLAKTLDFKLDYKKNAVLWGSGVKGQIGAAFYSAKWEVGQFGAWVSDHMRMFQTGYDLGTQFLHGLPVLARDPERWAKTYGQTSKILLMNDEERGLYVAGVLNNHRRTATELAQYNVPLGRGSNDIFIALDASATNNPTKLTQMNEVRKNLLRKAQGAFELTTDLAKIYTWESQRAVAAQAGERGLHDLAASIRNMSGSQSLDFLGIAKSQQRIERGWLAFSSRYTRSAMAVIGNVTSGGVRGAEARKTITQLGASIPLWYTAFAIGLNQTPKLDPRPKRDGGDGGDFMTLEVGDTRVGVGGFYMSFIKFATKMMAGDGDVPDKFKDADMQDNLLLRTARSRTSPLSGAIWDQWASEDYLGYPLEGWGRGTHVFNSFSPFWASTVAESAERALSEDPLSKGFLSAPFEALGLQARPNDLDLRDQLRAQHMRQEYPEFWDDVPGNSISEKWDNTPKGIQDSILSGFFDDDPNVKNNLRQLEDKINSNRVLRGKNITKQVQALHDELDEADNRYHREIERVRALFTGQEYDDELGFPTPILPAMGFREFREQIDEITRARSAAKSDIFSKEEHQLALEYFDEIKEKNLDDPVEPMLDMALNEYIDLVMSPPENVNPRLKQEAQEKWETKWGDRYWEAIQTMWSLKTHALTDPFVKEYHTGRYDLFDYYFDETTMIEEIISARPDAGTAREIWDGYSRSDELEKKVIWKNEIANPYAAQIIKEVESAQRKVKEELRKRDPELECFLNRWGFVTTFLNPELKDLSWLPGVLRYSKQPFDLTEEGGTGYSQLYSLE